MTAVAIFASGRGSNFEAIHAAVQSAQLDAEIRLVISDQPNAPVLAKARERGLRAICVEPLQAGAQAQRREEHESRILARLKEVSPRFLVMAGYMRILSPLLIEAFRSERGYARIVNVHPSLLPAFRGTGAYRQAFDYGAKLTGATIHLVEDEVDGGPICAQEAFSIADCRSAEDVERRGLAVEHRLFTETLKWVLPEAFTVEQRSPLSGRYCVRAS